MYCVECHACRLQIITITLFQQHVHILDTITEYLFSFIIFIRPSNGLPSRTTGGAQQQQITLYRYHFSFSRHGLMWTWI